MKPEQNSRTISLWQIIQSIQERLESQGLSAPVVDAVVKGNLERFLQYPAKVPG